MFDVEEEYMMRLTWGWGDKRFGDYIRVSPLI
jgi:hypothetical protein